MKLNMLLNESLGAQSAPIGLKKKCNAFMGAAGLLGAIMDWDAQTSANAINRQNAIETNQLNREINESQLAWAREQYNQEKLENRFLVDQAYQRELENRSHSEFYNSPAQQMARLRAAGINPSLAMYGGSGSVGASHTSSIGAQVGQNSHMSPPNMIPAQMGASYVPYTGYAATFTNMAQMALLGIQQDQEWVKILKDAPFDPATKDKFIRRKIFESDKAQNRLNMAQEEEYMALVNDNSMRQMELSIAQEQNDEKRKEWKRLADRHSKEMKILTNQINRYILDKQLLEDQHLLNEDKHSFNEKGLEILQKEIDRIGREEQLWSGDFSFRNVIELFMRIFTGGNIVQLLSLMK